MSNPSDSPGSAPKPPPEPLAPVPRVVLKREDAARAVGMSLDSFERYVQPHLELIRRGRLLLVPVESLSKWANDAAERTIP